MNGEPGLLPTASLCLAPLPLPRKRLYAHLTLVKRAARLRLVTSATHDEEER